MKRLLWTLGCALAALGPVLVARAVWLYRADVDKAIAENLMAWGIVSLVLAGQCFYSGRSRLRRWVPEAVDGQGAPIPLLAEFPLAVRGYDQDQVNLMLARVAVALTHDDSSFREAQARIVRDSKIDIVWNGYERKIVDRFMAEMAETLLGP